VEKFQTWRVSLTFPILNHARHLLFLVAGADKADMLRRIHAEPLGDNPLPIQRIVAQGAVEWLLDSAAAAQLPSEMTS
jgi:6-phosphogluconolactonase